MTKISFKVIYHELPLYLLPKIINQNIDIKISQAFFSGLGRDETAGKYNVSTGKVSTAWTELKSFIGPEGIALRDISIILKKNNITASKAKTGAIVASTLDLLDIDSDELTPFIEQVHSRAIEKGYSAADIIEDCESLNSLEEEYDGTYPEIKENFEKMGSKIEVDRNKIKELTENIIKLKRSETDLWEKYETDKESLEHFKKIKDTLTESGLNMNDPEKVAAVITAIKKEQYNIVPIIKKIEEIENIDGYRYVLDDEVKQLELEKQKNNTTLNTLKKEYETRMKQITKYHKLLSKGVTDDHIIRWENIIYNSNLNPTIIEEELKSQQNLIRFKEKIKKKTIDLKQTEKELNESITSLSTKKGQIEKSIETVQQAGIDRINSVTDSTSKQASAKLNIMYQNIADVQTRTQDTLEKSEKTNQQIINQTEKSVKETKNDLKIISKQLNSIADETVKAIEKIGILHPISDAYKFLDTGKGEPNIVIPLTRNFLQNLKAWLKSRGKLDLTLKSGIDRIIEEIAI